MSQRTQEVAGYIRHISDLLTGESSFSGCVHIPAVQFRAIRAGQRTLWIGLFPPNRGGEAGGEFIRLERRLVYKFFRLARLERLLSARARDRRRTGGGRSAIRLIELERQRLGRELHTGVGQLLAAIRLQIDVIATDLPDSPPRVGRSLENIAALALRALEQVRAVSQRIHPPEWQRLTLGAALRQLWELSAIPDYFQGQLEIGPMPVEPVPEVKALLFRAMQEALSNLLRHSRATRVEAALQVMGDQVVLNVLDNGVGFDVASLRAAPPNVSAGIGIRSIREQVEGLGGKFDIESGVSGTKLVVSVLLAPSD